MLAINSAMQRLLVLPPTTPQPALEALQAAVVRLNSDKAFADDALRTIGFVPEYVAGPQVNRQVRQTLVVKPEIKAFVADYIKKANK
jgi:tripartite-type tricarboxylate transporter receptor subunit TctC